MTTPNASSLAGSYIQVGPANRYGAGWRILGNLFGLLPTVALMAVFIPAAIASILSNNPILMIALTPVYIGIYLLSLFLNGLFNGNPFLPGRFSQQYGFFGQLTLNPRLFTGVMGAIEDADDFGYLRFESGWVVFDGSAVTLRVHYSDLAGVRAENIGLRALLCGKAVRFELRAPVSGFSWFRFHAREGLTAIKQRRMSAALVNYARAARLPGYMET